MSILTEMGIQQWRLRPRAQAVDAHTNPQPLIEHEVSEQLVSAAQHESPEIPKLNSQPAEQAPAEPQASLEAPAPLTASPAPMPLSPIASPPIASPSTESPPITPEPNTDPIANLDWQGLQNLVDGQAQCPTCGVGKSLLGAGDPNAKWLFVVDAPHSQDIASQQLLNARSGQLFESMLSAVGLERSAVYITSVFKCVASDDLSLAPNCDKILHRQMELIKPQVVIAFGEFAAQSVIKANETLEVLRTSEQTCFRTKVPIVPTYTTVQMLDEPSLKAAVWQDLKRCLSISAAHS